LRLHRRQEEMMMMMNTEIYLGHILCCSISDSLAGTIPTFC
jgi:hypothetical protein